MLPDGIPGGGREGISQVLDRVCHFRPENLNFYSPVQTRLRRSIPNIRPDIKFVCLFWQNVHPMLDQISLKPYPKGQHIH